MTARNPNSAAPKPPMRNSVRVKRTIIDPHGGEGKTETFHVPLSKRTIGPGINNQVIYDLKKKGRATYEFADGSSYLFENLDFAPPEMQPANENP